MLTMIFAMQRLISNVLYCVLFVYFHFGVKGSKLNFAVCVSLCKVVYFLCTFTLASKGARESSQVCNFSFSRSCVYFKGNFVLLEKFCPLFNKRKRIPPSFIISAY